MTAGMPLVSVCIPTFNRAERLHRAITRLLENSYTNLEIIVSDNGSTDATQQVAAELCNCSGRVRYFRHPVNRGPTKNFEFARAQARGKYFLWHGDDDYLAADFITLCVQELERDASLVLVSGLAAYHGGDHVITRFGNVIQPGAGSKALRVLMYLWLVDDNSIFCGVYRREAVAGCALPNFLAGDWAWVAEALGEGRAKVLPCTHAYREEGENNTSRSLENIVTVHGLPRWHARHPWLAIPLNLANYLSFGSAASRRKHLPAKVSGWTAVFSVAFAKQVLVRVGPKIPFASTLRRMLGGPGKPQARER